MAVDSTGFQLTHCSAHYRNRPGARDRRGWAKLTTCVDVATHLILAALATKGPSYDAPLFGPVVRRAATHVRLGRVLADAGYDAERHHGLCARLGAEALIAVNPRGAPRVRSPHRRRARWRLARQPARARYGQRWQVESAFSRQKRRTGDALRARGEAAQRTELLLRALTHNLLILLPARLQTFQQSNLTPHTSHVAPRTSPHPIATSSCARRILSTVANG